MSEKFVEVIIEKMKIPLVALILPFFPLCLSSFADVMKVPQPKSLPKDEPKEELDCANSSWSAQERCAAREGEAERKASSLELKKKYGSAWSSEISEAIERLQKMVREFSQLEAVATSDSVHGEHSRLENEIWRDWLNDVIRQMETDAVSADEAKAAQDSDQKLNAIYAKGFKAAEECRKAQRAWLKVRDEIAEIYQLRFKNKFDPKTLKDIALNRATIRRIRDYQKRLDI